MFMDLNYQEAAVQELPPFSGLLAVPQVRRESISRSKNSERKQEVILAAPPGIEPGALRRLAFRLAPEGGAQSTAGLV